MASSDPTDIPWKTTSGEVTASSGEDGGVVSRRLLVILATLAIILASVALIVAVISLTQNATTDVTVVSAQNGPAMETENKIWTIAIGHYTNNNVYIDQRSGLLKGFHVDIINAVCRVANKNCRLMYDIWQRCWISKAGEVPRGGEGLIGGWYDACAGWIKSYERARTFQFGKSWNMPPKFYFIVKAGNPNNFNPRDVTDVKFGFVDGFVNDEFCLARQTGIRGSTLTPSQIAHYPLPGDVQNAVIAGEVVAAIMVGLNLPPTLMRLEDVVIDCSMDSSGGGIMLRMDNALNEWWDPALERLMQTSEYREICQDIKDEHGHMPGRNPEEACIGL